MCCNSANHCTSVLPYCLFQVFQSSKKQLQITVVTGWYCFLRFPNMSIDKWTQYFVIILFKGAWREIRDRVFMPLCIKRLLHAQRRIMGIRPTQRHTSVVQQQWRCVKVKCWLINKPSQQTKDAEQSQWLHWLLWRCLICNRVRPVSFMTKKFFVYYDLVSSKLGAKLKGPKPVHAGM